MRQLLASGLSRGTSGNASVRYGTGMLITPTGVSPDQLFAHSMTETDLDGRLLAGELAPSSEWPMHAAIYRARADAQAIVHCHSRYATALACCGRGIPAFHYMVAVAGGDSLRCAPYALFGSDSLADLAVTALHDRRACLLGNHGQITIGRTLDAALALAVEVEALAAQYWATLAIDGPRLLSAAEMAEVQQKFAGYGQPRPPAA